MLKNRPNWQNDDNDDKQSHLRPVVPKQSKGKGRDHCGFSLPKVNFLVLSLLMFNSIDNEIEALGAYIKEVSKM